MKLLTSSLDKSAITISVLCIFHCLLLPVLIVLLPSLAATALNTEMFHILMVVCVLPISIYALTMGCKKHNKRSVLYTGLVGLLTLVAALVFGESHLGEVGEKLWTTIGSVIMAIAHIRNFKLCQQSESCSC